jgi:Fe-S-cluster containining protein
MTERGVSFDTKDAFIRPLIEGSTRVALDLFEDPEAADDVSEVVSQIHDFAGEMARTLTARVEEVRRLPLACEEGCSYCCRGTPVLVSAPEAIALATHLRKTRTPQELEALRERVAAAHARVRDLDVDARAEAKEACPLLDTERGVCTAYEARPTACRAYNSCDRSRCAEAFDAGLASPTLPSNPILFRATHASGFGLMVATELRGRETGPYELVHALDTALADADIERRWAAGETVFSHTRLSDEGAIAFRDIISGLASDFREGRMRETAKIAQKVDPEARRRERNRRKAQGKKR